MSSVESMNSAYRALASRAWDSNRARAAELVAILAEWRRIGDLTVDQREHARAVAHSLRGSAATFGHERASEAAQDLEELLVADAPPPPLLVVETLVEQVGEALTQPPEYDV